MTAEVVPMNASVPIDKEAVLRHLKLNPNDPATQALLLVCDRYGLDPLLKHMVLIQGRPYVTRDGYLHLAHQSGQLDGIEVLDEGEEDAHLWARVAVYRKDMSRPFVYKGRYPKAGGNKDYGPEMAIKCAEVAALRRAFNVTGIGAADEKWDDAEPHVEDTGITELREANREFVQRVSDLEPEDRKVFVDWKNEPEQRERFVFEPGVGYPEEALIEMGAFLDAIETGVPDDREASASEPERPSGPESTSTPVSGYLAWPKDDLVAECATRGLPKSGTKEHLVEELTAWDALEGAPWDPIPDARPF